MSKKTFTYFLIFGLLLLISPLISFGQSTLDSGFLELSLNPGNPEPLQLITVTLKSLSYDLDRSKITWLVNGSEKKTDIGLKEFSVTAGKSGQKTTVRARVETPTDGTKQIETTFVPAVVDLIYEALTYTPPFYHGKALNPNQGTVIVVALPELVRTTGEKVPTKNIVYTWRKDGKVVQAASGLGKNSFTFSGSVPIRDAEISVTAAALEGELSATKQVRITNVTPKIIFYENSPLYGLMFNRAITNTVKLVETELSVVALPYFFTVSSAASKNLNYVWSLNGQEVANQDPKNSFTVRLEKAGVGVADIGLKINNTAQIFQFTDNHYNINFEKQ